MQIHGFSCYDNDISKKTRAFLEETLDYLKYHTLTLCMNSYENPPTEQRLLEIVQKLRKIVMILDKRQKGGMNYELYARFYES